MATDQETTDRHRDWSGLPPELVANISRNVTLVTDYASFRAACTSWYSATGPFRLPPQLPWLTLPRKPTDAVYSDYGGEKHISDDFRECFSWIGDSDSRQFFSLAAMKSHLLYLPEARRMQFLGVGHGWLLATGCPEMLLLNPFTRAQVQLPSITDFPVVMFFKSLPSKRGYVYALNDLERNELPTMGMRNSFVMKAAVSAHPAISARFAVMVSIDEHRKLGYCWTGDKQWTMVDAGFKSEATALTFFDGRFYAVESGKVVAIDVRASPAKVTTLPSLEEQRCALFYLLVSEGKLMLVGRYQKREFEGKIVIDFKDYFHIFELDLSAKKPKWLRVKDIGDRCLFLAANSSLSVTASDYPGFCKPNCIYFADFFDCRETHYDGTEGHNVGVYRIENDSLELISTYSDGICMWHRASWILPSLC